MSGKKCILLLVLFIYPILSIGCNFKEQLKKQFGKIVPKETDKFARTYIDILRKGDIEQAEKLLDSRIANSKTRSELQKCFNYLNQGEPISTEVISVTILRKKGERRTNLKYQLQFKETWLLTSVTVADIDGKQQILGFHVNTIPRSLEEINAFTLSGKSFRHYIILLIAIGIPIFIICMIVLCVRTKMKRKWLWIIFMLLGFGRLSFNWTSGQMGYQPLFIQLIPTSAFKGLYAPLFIYISVPVGALLFILKRYKIKKTESVDIYKAPDSNNQITEDIDS
ncbi:MAG: hypothetical protein PVJ60_05900 [Phycisphaerales bacterium]|jgi:hypothetical protein